MKNKKLIRLTESDLHRIVKLSVNRVLNETRNMKMTEGRFNRNIIDESINEGWLKNTAMAGAMGLGTMFGGPSANAQNVQQNYNKQDTVQVQGQNKFSERELIKMFKNAYKDRKKGPEVWMNNQTSYVGTLPNGKISLIGKIAASRGENPWDAIVKRYVDNTKQNNDNIFTLSDFDIQ